MDFIDRVDLMRPLARLVHWEEHLSTYLASRESGVNILHTWFDFEKIFWLQNALIVNSSFLTNIEPCQESQISRKVEVQIVHIRIG